MTQTLSDAGFRVEPADYQADFKDLRAIREPVFVVEQQVPLEEEWDELDPVCHHVIARDDAHRPIGTGRLTPEQKMALMTHPSTTDAPTTTNAAVSAGLRTMIDAGVRFGRA